MRETIVVMSKPLREYLEKNRVKEMFKGERKSRKVETNLISTFVRAESVEGGALVYVFAFEAGRVERESLKASASVVAVHTAQALHCRVGEFGLGEGDTLLPTEMRLAWFAFALLDRGHSWDPRALLVVLSCARCCTCPSVQNQQTDYDRIL